MPHCEDCLRQSPEAGPCYPHTSWRRRLPGAEATCASADCTHVPKRLSTCPSPTAVADPGAPKAGTLAPKSMLCLRLLNDKSNKNWLKVQLNTGLTPVKYWCPAVAPSPKRSCLPTHHSL